VVEGINNDDLSAHYTLGATISGGSTVESTKVRTSSQIWIALLFLAYLNA